jgi:hypothetical protein
MLSGTRVAVTLHYLWSGVGVSYGVERLVSSIKNDRITAASQVSAS